MIRQLADDSTLADSRLTEHRDDSTGPGGGVGELRAQALDLLRASDELALGTRRLSLGGVRRRPRRHDCPARPLPQDLLVEDLRRRLRLDPELSL